mgnify:CR=1 FL=1
MTQNKFINEWISEMAAMTTPDSIVWIDGTNEQAEKLRAEACSTGEIIKLNQELLPDCYLHRTAINDVARVEGRTFICTSKKEDAGNINNWMDPQECYAKLSKLYKGSMKGRTMYVIPYSMSVVGSPFAKYGIELTDSIYVVLNMLIMTRVGTNVLEALGDSADYIKGLHARADIDENNFNVPSDLSNGGGSVKYWSWTKRTLSTESDAKDKEGCYTYIKEIIKGESYIELAEEEAEALDKAIFSEVEMEMIEK